MEREPSTIVLISWDRPCSERLTVLIFIVESGNDVTPHLIHAEREFSLDLDFWGATGKWGFSDGNAGWQERFLFGVKFVAPSALPGA